MLTTENQTQNVFARFARGTLQLPPDALEANLKLPADLQEEYMICFNRKEANEKWNSNEEGVVGKASMSKRHVFVTIKNLSWTRFNVLVYGMFNDHAKALATLRGPCQK